MINLTDRQTEVLNFIIQFRKDREYSPTFREIADGMKFTVRVAVDYIAVLEKKGYITREKKLSRSIKVLN